MRRIGIIVITMLFFLTGVISFTSQVYAQSAKKVLMIPREGFSTDLDLMIKMEVGVMNLILKNAGYTVDIATSSGQNILGPTLKIEKVARLSEIKLDDYAGVIMPCMAVGMFPGPPVSPEAVAATRKALADGKPVAAAANATIVLAEAGILKGKRYAFAVDPLNPPPPWTRTDRRFEGAIYSGAGVVQDGKIISSGICPTLERFLGKQNGTVELTQKFITLLGPR